MSMSNKKKIKYEKAVADSIPEFYRLGVDTKQKTVSLEFGFLKNDEIAIIDSSKVVEMAMLVELINGLEQALARLNEISGDNDE